MVGDILQPTHLLFVLVVALLVLGPKRLPEVGRTLGSGIRDFRQAISGESGNPLHDWTSEVAQSSEPELHHQVPDKADAEATVVSEPDAGAATFPGEVLSPTAADASAADTPTAVVVERPPTAPRSVGVGSPRPAETGARPAGAAPRPARPARRIPAGTRPAPAARPVRPRPAPPARPASAVGDDSDA